MKMHDNNGKHRQHGKGRANCKDSAPPNSRGPRDEPSEANRGKPCSPNPGYGPRTGTRPRDVRGGTNLQGGVGSGRVWRVVAQPDDSTRSSSQGSAATARGNPARSEVSELATASEAWTMEQKAVFSDPELWGNHEWAIRALVPARAGQMRLREKFPGGTGDPTTWSCFWRAFYTVCPLESAKQVALMAHGEGVSEVDAIGWAKMLQRQFLPAPIIYGYNHWTGLVEPLYPTETGKKDNERLGVVQIPVIGTDGELKEHEFHWVPITGVRGKLPIIRREEPPVEARVHRSCQSTIEELVEACWEYSGEEDLVDVLEELHQLEEGVKAQKPTPTPEKKGTQGEDLSNMVFRYAFGEEPPPFAPTDSMPTWIGGSGAIGTEQPSLRMRQARWFHGAMNVCSILLPSMRALVEARESVLTRVPINQNTVLYAMDAPEHLNEKYRNSNGVYRLEDIITVQTKYGVFVPGPIMKVVRNGGTYSLCRLLPVGMNVDAPLWRCAAQGALAAVSEGLMTGHGPVVPNGVQLRPRAGPSDGLPSVISEVRAMYVLLKEVAPDCLKGLVDDVRNEHATLEDLTACDPVEAVRRLNEMYSRVQKLAGRTPGWGLA